ncbi:hypothetical protein [Chelatococcus sp.]|uniref:hypothetical protein n=1 Tax=Chelatococcus sp. TaxID=1953771 RepID=UPI001EC527CF|nr:hypothetical protein [Chelatococcus sp.]MBX3543586.1 hypothetical protein [Chelatococcus sp.]
MAEKKSGSAKTVDPAVTKPAVQNDETGAEATGIEPATEFDPSGAPHQVQDIDVDHPAVDNDPRANTTADQNRIDFNDPTLSGAEAVAKNLKR